MTAAAQESHTSTVVMVIQPGEFTATLTFEQGIAILTVDDATGTGRGWWVTVECSCRWERIGAVQTLVGNPADGPQWEGSSLVARRNQGVGIYRQPLGATFGDLVITASQGERP